VTRALQEQCPQGLSPGHSIHRELVGALEVSERPFGARAEAAVDRHGRPAPSEQVLQD
jgi:hypothetical protein